MKGTTELILIIIVSLVFLSIAGFLSSKMERSALEKLQAQAVNKGYAEFVPDAATNLPVFQWKKTLEKP